MKPKWRDEVKLFREWATAQVKRWQETEWRDFEDYWQTNYSGWETLCGSVLGFLRESDPHSWSEEEIEDLFYVLWYYWDSDGAEDLYQLPEAALVLAVHSFESSEPDIRRQLAGILAHLPSDSRIDPLLLRFMDDDVEVVRRYALQSLARIGCAQVEFLALREWNRKSDTVQWARMMALWVWRRIDSPLLEAHLREAEVSPYAYLSYFAQNLRNSEVDLA